MVEAARPSPPIASQFPIVASNLRVLVSSWLPPARDPSPIEDDHDSRAENTQARPERVALGAVVATDPRTTESQDRMNKKLGVSMVNGVKKVTAIKKSNVDREENDNVKRKLEVSDSEEDSKSKLVTKRAERKSDKAEEKDKNKRKEKKEKKHKAAKTLSETPQPSVQSPRKVDDNNPKTTDNISIGDIGANKEPSEHDNSSPLSSPSKKRKDRDGTTDAISSDLEKEADDSGFVGTSSRDKDETKEEERRRRKRERKKERKRLKRLEKEQKKKEATGDSP